MIGKTNSSQGVSSIPSEYVNIRMMTNQASHGDLVGAKFVLSYEKFSQEYVWGGSEMTLQVPAYVVCTIEWGDVEGYKKPEAVTFTTVEDNARTIEVEYQCELLTVNVTADEGVPTGFEVTISKAEAIGGIKGYTRLEYIESTGTQYIDTGFVPTLNSKVVYDIQFTTTSMAQYSGLRVSGPASLMFGVYAKTEFYFGSTTNTLLAADTNRKSIVFDIVNKKLSVDGVDIITNGSYSAGSDTLPIFAMKTSGMFSRYCYMKLYSCQIYDNGTLVRDYIPVKDSNGVAGLYDKVNNVFYPSNSDSSFIAGQEITHKKIEYIESTGTQWIDTGFKPSSNTRIVIDMEPTSSSTGFLFGARVNSSANAQSKSFSFVNISGTSLRSDFGSVENSINMSPLQRLTIDKNKNVTTVNGQSVTATSQTFSSSYNLYLLTVNTAGAVGAYVAAKIYSCKIYDNGVLIRDYIPVKDSNGVAGLYDKVNNVFYPSNSDSKFIAGKEITYKKIEYIENNGNAWINTGFIANGGMKATIGITPYDVSKQYLFYGSHNPMSNSSDSTWQRNNIAIDNNSQWEVGQSTNIFTFAVSTEANAKYDVEFSTIVNAAPYAVINGQKYTGTYKTGLNIAPTTPVYIMKDVYYENQFLKGKIHYAKIWDKALNLVRDFIPMLRSDGVAGLYDLVNDSFYASSGSDAFIAGPSIGEVIYTQVSALGTYKIPFDVPYNIEASDIDGFGTPVPISRVASEKAYVATMEYKAIGAKDLSLMDVYGNKIQRSTANCYVVRESGQYKFPLVFGNAIKNGKVNTAAFTNNGGAYSHDFVYGTPYTSYESDVITQPYINPYFALSSSDVQIETSDVDGAITDLGLEDGNECKFVTFKVANVPSTGGNVIITLNTAYGDYWSWHIWLWPHDLSPVEITNATGVKYKIMPVNLASKYDSDGVHIKNWFYQWGRPNPMLCPNAWNSATDHSPGVITKTSKADTLKIGIMNPSKFYYNSASPCNWFGTKSYYNLWDAACTGTGNSDNDTVKTVYDPCPVGWKVPNGNTFTGLSIIGNANGIIKMRRYSGDTVGVGFPISGCRYNSNGLLVYIGSSGYVWLSSANSQDYAYHLDFHSGGLYPRNNSHRANGFSVRPVQDDNIWLDVIMISFTIYDEDNYIEWICEAESGMTWFEWVNSGYNTAGATISGNSVIVGGKDVREANRDYVDVPDKIMGGHQYITI